MSANEGSRTQHQFTVKGMHCKSCAMLVQDAVEEIGATDVKITIDEKKNEGVVTLAYAGKRENIIRAIESEGYEPQ